MHKINYFYLLYKKILIWNEMWQNFILAFACLKKNNNVIVVDFSFFLVFDANDANH
jgi:hypothetical protein